MPGYPDSHLGDSRNIRSKWVRRLLVAAPLILAALWIYLYWFSTNVFPVTEDYPGGQLKYAGYVRRIGLETYKRHGHWVTYHPNGKQASDGFYESGRKVGEWKYWDSEGRPTGPPKVPKEDAAGP